MKLTPFLLLAVSPGFAFTTLNDRVSKLESEMQDVRTETVYKNAGAKTVSATPKLDRYGPFLSLDLLCWKLFIGGTDYAYTNTVSTYTPIFTPNSSHLKEFNFNWRCGVRSALGYQFANPDWDISAIYTHYSTDQVEHLTPPAGGFLSPSGIPSYFQESSATIKWGLSWNVLDLDLARAYFVRSRFSAHPRMGLRTAWIHQKDHVTFVDAVQQGDVSLKHTTRTAGAGLLGGTELRWHWSNQWSLFSNLIASLIYGKVHVKAEIVNLTTDAKLLDVSADTYKVLPNMSIDTGLTWEMSWKRVRMSVAAGYEFQYWWRQNQRPHLDSGTAYSWVRNAEDLGFHGFKFNMALDF